MTDVSNDDSLPGENELEINRRSLEEKMEYSEKRFWKIFENSVAGIFIIDADTGKIADANPAAAEILGFSRDEFINRELCGINSFMDGIAGKIIDEIQAKGFSRHFNLIMKTKSGEPINVEFSGNYFFLRNGKIIQCTFRNKAGQHCQDTLSRDLQVAIEKIEQLKKIIPVCLHCKRIREVNDYLERVESYIAEYPDDIPDGILCEECKEKINRQKSQEAYSGK